MLQKNPYKRITVEDALERLNERLERKTMNYLEQFVLFSSKYDDDTDNVQNVSFNENNMINVSQISCMKNQTHSLFRLNTQKSMTPGNTMHQLNDSRNTSMVDGRSTIIR